MASAKDIILKPIPSKQAEQLVRQVHYSGKVVQNSQVHIGVFLHGKLEGAMQFGPSLDKRKVQGLVEGTGWNEFIELNRMAFTDNLPRNSESRALGVAMRLLRKHAPHLKWVISFADACQCGDGTIYRASGFVLTGIKQSQGDIWVLPEHLKYLSEGGRPCHKIAIQCKTSKIAHWVVAKYQNHNIPLRRLAQDNGGHVVSGHQLRYIYFLDKAIRQNLTVAEIPFSRIAEMGVAMYRGKRATEVGD